MTHLQIWLQNHNRRLTQDAIDEALMEYINKVEAERDELKTLLAESEEDNVRIRSKWTPPEAIKGCPNCGSTAIHACMGQAPRALTDEDKAAFKEAFEKMRISR